MLENRRLSAARLCLLVLALSSIDSHNCDHSTKTCNADQKSTLDRAKALTVTTNILLLTGLSAIGTGLVLMLLESGEAESEEDSAVLTSTRPVAAFGCSKEACFGSLILGF